MQKVAMWQKPKGFVTVFKGKPSNMKVPTLEAGTIRVKAFVKRIEANRSKANES